jgi:hypothetical protein
VTQLEHWTDITQHFDFIEESLVYVDSPLEGHLRAKDGELFAFRCQAIIEQTLWHWVLLPIASTEVGVDDAFKNAINSPPQHWLSLVEDRRGPTPTITAAMLATSSHPLPRAVLEQ